MDPTSLHPNLQPDLHSSLHSSLHPDLHESLELILLYQFSLLLIAVMSFLLIKGWYVWQASLKAKRQKQIQGIVLDFLKNRQICLKSIAKYLLKIDELLPCIELFDTLIADSLWETIKLALFYDYILPRARKDTFSKSFIKRYWAARAFAFYAQPADMHYVKVLLEDRLLNIQTLAISTAVRFGEKKMIEAAVSTLAKEPLFRRCKLYYLIQQKALLHFNVLLEILKESHEASVKEVCFHLLYQQESKELTDQAIATLRHGSKDLRLLASKKLVRDLKQEALPYLLPCLEDGNDEVRYSVLKKVLRLMPPEQHAQLKNHYPDTHPWVSHLYFLAFKALDPKFTAQAYNQSQDSNPRIFYKKRPAIHSL